MGRMLRKEMDILREEVSRFRRAEMAPTTEIGYEHDWRNFERWCRRARRQALPASPDTVALWIADLLRNGKKVATVYRYACGVAHRHRRDNYPNPVDDTVHEALRGARRMRCEPLRQMAPLSVVDLRLVADALADKNSSVAVRDRAIVVLGFATALRRSSLAILRCEDVTFCDDGLSIFIRREKQDRRGTGRQVAATFGEHESTCPVRALKAWLAIRGESAGPLFNRLDSGHVGKLDGLTPSAIGEIVKGAISGAGVRGRYNSHSLRSGLITAAGIAGVNHLVIAGQSGHASLDSLKRYFRPADLFRSCAASMIGL
jgi:integrase